MRDHYGAYVNFVETLPVKWYTDPAIFELERHPVFACSWIHIGFEYEIANAGDYITENIAGWPIFVRRGENGDVRAFHNVCPHRAGPIVWDGSGCSANLVCRYHGWAFNSEGTLLNARDFGAEVSEGMNLTAVRAQVWRGMVFVCLDPATSELIEWLAEFPPTLAEFPLEDYVFHTRSVRRVACNWKTYADNFLEGYHVPTVHPAMTRDSDAMNYKVILNEDPRWNVHVMPPRYTSTFSVFGWFWPTFAFDVLPQGFAYERWLPRGVGHIDLIVDYFFSADATDIDSIISFSEEIVEEDAKIANAVQVNLSSGMYTTGILSPKWEDPLAVFHALVRNSVPQVQ